MPKLLEADAAYEAAERYRVGCIRDSRSLLWPSDKVWTLANVAAARETLQGTKGEGGPTFLEHWRQRLSPLTPEVNQVGIDGLALYYLLLDMNEEAKLAKVAAAVSWKLAPTPALLVTVRSPPMALAMRLTKARPRPAPPKRRAV